MIIVVQRFLVRIFIIALFCPRRNKQHLARENILVLKSGGLGDFLFAIPSFNLLQKNSQNRDFALLTYNSVFGSHTANMAKKKLDGVPWLELVEHQFSTVHILDDLRLTSIRKLRREFQETAYDSVILMPCPGEPFYTTMKRLLLLRLLGLRRCDVYGIGQDYSTSFFRKYHAQWGIARHKIYGPWRAVEEFLSSDVEISDSYLQMEFGEPTKFANISSLFKKLDMAIDRYVLVSPGSIAPWKNWGIENFLMLIERLAPTLKTKGVSILIAGPPSDSVLAQELKILDNIVDICGRYTIPELAAIHRGAICSLAVDGGAAHLAGFSGGNVISLSNGGEEPGVVTPVGANVIEHRHLTACTPCFGMDKCPLEHSSCVRDIKVDEVLKSILAFVEGTDYIHSKVGSQ